MISTILRKVCASLHVEPTKLFKTNKEEYVDARALVCQLYSENGLTDSEIARIFGVTRQCVNKLKNTFNERCFCKWTLRMAYRTLHVECAVKRE